MLWFFINIINLYNEYDNVVSVRKFNRSWIKDNEHDKKKRYENRFENSSKDSLSEETKLVERKLKDDRARKRTRGPYRKSHLK